MSSFSSIFKGKRITQVGLGLLGRGVGDADFLARQGAELVVTDLKTKEMLVPSYDALASYTNISWRLGEHVLSDFYDRDLILKGAGVPFDSTYIVEARKAGVPIDMSASLFARIAQIPLVGVTGTRGKSTVTHLIHAILKAEGRETLLGGNVQGVSNLALLEKVTPKSIGVFELDSWQCQGFGEERSLDAQGVLQGAHSPSVGVFTTFMPDHLNYYQGDVEAYLEDKLHIFSHQKEGDIFVMGKGVQEVLAPYKKRMRAEVIVADDVLPKGWTTKLLGAHNVYNIAIAIAVARALGVEEDTIRTAVADFAPLKGRLELVRTLRGVEIYNDTNATTPEAVQVALEALDPEQKKRVVLIAGGADKKLDLTPFVKSVEAHTKARLLLNGTGTSLLPETVRNAPNTKVVESLEEAVHEAYGFAKEGDCILFSPGFASFGMFANEYDRGERFVACIEEMH